jgi:hypothetical protein
MVQIVRWIDPDTTSVWMVLNSIRTSMMCSSLCDYDRFIALRDDDRPCLAHYDWPVLMYCSSIAYNGQSWHLLNMDGAMLAGSNIYDQSFSRPWALCLGGTVNPITLHPVELMLANGANSDLCWLGGELEGEWIEDQNQAIFKIDSWPSCPEMFQVPVPAAVAANCSAWSQR